MTATNGLSPARLLRRQARGDAGAVATVAVLALALGFLVAALPRSAGHTYDRALQEALAAASPGTSDIYLDAAGGPADTHALAAGVAALPRTFPAQLQRFARPGTYGVNAPDLHLARRDASTRLPSRLLAIRVQSRLAGHVRFVSGRLARGPGASGRSTAASGRAGLPLIEVAVAAAAARDLQLQTGDEVLLVDPLAPPFAIRVSGLFRPLDPGDDFWVGQPRALAAAHDPTETDDLYRGTSFASPAAYPRLLRLFTGNRLDIRYRYPLATERMASQDVPALRHGLDRLQSTGVAPSPGRPPLAALSGLGPLLDRVAVDQQSAATLAAVDVLVVVALGITLVVLALQILVARRDPAVRMAVARGASPRQVTAGLGAEQAVTAMPAAVVGGVLALILVAGRDDGSAAARAVLVGLAVAASGTLLAAVRGRAAVLSGPASTTRRQDPAAPGGSRRRVVAECLLVLVGAAAVAALRRRGLVAATSPGDGSGGIDPLLVGMPVLVGAAVGLLALRGYPWLLRGASRMTSRRRGLASLLASARPARTSVLAALPALTLLISVAFAVFSATLAGTLDRGQDVASWQRVGADARVEGLTFQPAQRRLVAGVAGVRAVTGAYSDDQTELVTAASSSTPSPRVRLWAVTAADARSVLGDAPTDPHLPGAFGDSTSASRGVAAVVTPDLAARAREGRLRLLVDGTVVGLRVVGTGSDYPGLPAGASHAVVDLAALRRATGRTFAPNVLLLRAPGVKAAPLQAATDRIVHGLQVVSRSDVQLSLRSSALTRGLTMGIRAGVGCAVLAAVLAVLLGLLAGGPARVRTLGLLRAIGLSTRQLRVVVFLDVAPLLTLAVLLGVPLGIVLSRLVLPAVDLRPFTGSEGQPALWMDPLLTTALVALLVVLLAAAVATATALTTHARPIHSLRADET